LMPSIHPSAWKGCSPKFGERNSSNFALTEFSEVHYFGDAPRIQRYI
jgi:hypothetical protein